jgi:hypothetical protein
MRTNTCQTQALELLSAEITNHRPLLRMPWLNQNAAGVRLRGLVAIHAGSSGEMERLSFVDTCSSHNLQWRCIVRQAAIVELVYYSYHSMYHD